MWIMVAGPYSAGGADAERRAENLRALNAAAAALQAVGHVPVVGVNMALPMIEAAGGGEDAYRDIMMPVSLALAARCDACLRLGGASAGADAEVARFREAGKPVYFALDAVPATAGARPNQSGAMACVIRPATAQDEPALAEQFQGLNLYEEPFIGDRRLDADGGRDSLAACRARVDETEGHALVAERDGHVVGHMFMWFESDPVFVRPELRRHAYVADLFVRDAARGHGIGMALLAEAERLARAAGVPRIKIGVLAGNDGAEALYRRAGYRPYAVELSKRLA